MKHKKPTKTDIEKLKAELDKVKPDNKAGEELERLIGWRSLTFKDWHRPFTI